MSDRKSKTAQSKEINLSTVNKKRKLEEDDLAPSVPPTKVAKTDAKAAANAEATATMETTEATGNAEAAATTGTASRNIMPQDFAKAFTKKRISVTDNVPNDDFHRNWSDFITNLHLYAMSDEGKNWKKAVPAPHANWKIPRVLEADFKKSFPETYSVLLPVCSLICELHFN